MTDTEADDLGQSRDDEARWLQIDSADQEVTADLSQDDHDRIQDRLLRQGFMRWMLSILIGLLAVVNGGVLALAFGEKIQLGETTLSIWLTATLGQAYAIVRVIANNLFPNKASRHDKLGAT
jgi:hypothetical protein